MDLPVGLIEAVRSQRAVLFLGTGASKGATHPKALDVPEGLALRDLISDRFLSGALKDRSLQAVSAMAASEVGLVELQRYIHDLFEPYGPSEFHSLIPTFRWRAVATTNYDLIIERAYNDPARRQQNLVKTVKDGDAYDSRSAQADSPLGYFKLHGCIDYWDDETIPLILGQEQYAAYAKNRQRLYGRLRDLAHDNPIIFCGYRIEDAHIQQLLFDLTDKSVSRPMYYHIARSTTPIEQRYWASHRVTCLSGTFEAFLRALDGAIAPTARVLPVSLGGGTLSIRNHYRVANASESSSLRSYLDTDAVHVHAAMAPGYQKPTEFYKGFDPGFGAVVQNLDVRRAVGDSMLVDAVLIPETAGTLLYILKGPAGNGKTVTLKRTAWEAATAYDQLVLYVTQASGLRIEPLREIAELTGKRIFLFVDRVALLRAELQTLIAEARTSNLSLTVIGAERDNEWNVYCESLDRFVRQDFAIRYLSEKAIRALLELLERHGALGLLVDKKPEERFAAFAERAEKQLLVALHETTSGDPFEKIILDEFERIEPAEARRLYLDICALHQFGAPVRAGLISRASGISFPDFAERFMAPLENVVLAEEDRHGGDIYYRSRHQHVSELVFAQALKADEEKFDVLADLMESMNIDYTSDRETWGRMVRGRSISAMFRSVDVGRLFYDRASQLSPNEGFVSHQRAVFEMQHPMGSLEHAERAIREAIDRNPGSRSFRHTQAEIARRQALEVRDPLKKTVLRRLARDSLKSKSGAVTDFDLGTHARLALDEFRELLEGKGDLSKGDQTSLLEAAKEAEGAIQRGLYANPDNADMLSIEATFRDLLQQESRARQSLEKAFNINPRQDWLAVRLARSYEQADDLLGAVAILERCLRDNPGSKMAHLEIAKLLMKLGKPSDVIADHLRRSFIRGDNNFEGQFWYARELFLQGKTEDAKGQFDALNEIATAKFRMTSSALVMETTGEPRPFAGTISRKEEGYAFIHYKGFQGDVFASRAESTPAVWEQLKSGMDVVGHLGFSRRGPRALKLRRPDGHR